MVFGPRKLQPVGFEDGNISVFLGQSSILMLRTAFKCFSLRMVQLNLIRDLLYSSINGDKDLGQRRNYEGIQYEEQMKLYLEDESCINVLL